MWDEEMQNMKHMFGNELAAAKEESAQVKASYEEQVAAANEEIVQIKASYEKQFAAANEENAQVMATYDEEVSGLKVQLNNISKQMKDVMAQAASYCLEFEKTTAHLKAQVESQSLDIDENDHT